MGLGFLTVLEGGTEVAGCRGDQRTEETGNTEPHFVWKGKYVVLANFEIRFVIFPCVLTGPLRNGAISFLPARPATAHWSLHESTQTLGTTSTSWDDLLIAVRFGVR